MGRTIACPRLNVAEVERLRSSLFCARLQLQFGALAPEEQGRGDSSRQQAQPARHQRRSEQPGSVGDQAKQERACGETYGACQVEAAHRHATTLRPRVVTHQGY
jgi:hypothetical protein